MPWDVIEETTTIDRWMAYEAEWRDTPFIDDLLAHVHGVHKAKVVDEIPMTKEEYFKRYGK